MSFGGKARKYNWDFKKQTFCISIATCAKVTFNILSSSTGPTGNSVLTHKVKYSQTEVTNGPRVTADKMSLL